MKKILLRRRKPAQEDYDLKLEENKKEIKFLNRFVLSQFFILLFYIPFEFFFLKKELITGHIIYALLSILSIILNKYKKFNLSKFYFIILMNVNIFFWVIEVGGKTNTEFFYLAAALFGFLLFRENKVIVVGQMFLSISLFFLAKELSQIITPRVELTDQMAKDISSMSNLIIFIIIFIIIKHLTEVWSENEEGLKRQNTLIEQKNQELNDSINYAKRIQRAIIPKMELINEFVFDGFELNMPKDKLSGDFSFYFRQSENVVWIAAADCTGHGIPGSLVSVLGVKILYKVISERKSVQSNEVLDFATQEMEENLNRFSDNIVKDGMDISITRLEKVGDEINICYSGANNPMWILADVNTIKDESYAKYKNSQFEEKVLIELPPDRQPIGIYFKRTLFSNHQLTLKKGSRLYLFTDGYTDQFGGPKDKKLTKRRLRDLIFKGSKEPIKKHKRKLENYVRDWAKESEQVDDILVLGIEL